MSTHTGMLTFDEEVGRTLAAAYQTPEMRVRRQAASKAVRPGCGERGLDIGPGPGFLACELAQHVGPTGQIATVDANPAMLALTQHQARQLGVADRVTAHEGDAAALPFPDGAFDFVVAVQVYEYVPDIERALAEAYRVLRPGGRLAVVDTDWDTLVLQTGDPDRTARISRAWDEHLAHRKLPQHLPKLLRQAGFCRREVTLVPVLTWEHAQATFSRVLIDLIASFAQGRAGVSAGDVEAWRADIAQQSADGDYFFSLNQYLFRAEKPGAVRGI
jgi:ubiquinone/menaquinone biosynthesis C-methylase UbiE